MEWSPGASFPHFSALRNGVARRRNAPVLFPSPPQRAIHGPSAHSPLASAICFPVPSPPAAYFLDVEKVGKDTPEGTYFEAVPSGLLPRRPRGLRPPLDSLGFTRDERRGTKDERRGFGRELRIAAPVCPLARNDGRRLHFAARSCEYTKTPLTYPVRGVISFLSRWR